MVRELVASGPPGPSRAPSPLGPRGYEAGALPAEAETCPADCCRYAPPAR